MRRMALWRAQWKTGSEQNWASNVLKPKIGQGQAEAAPGAQGRQQGGARPNSGARKEAKRRPGKARRHHQVRRQCLPACMATPRGDYVREQRESAVERWWCCKRKGGAPTDEPRLPGRAPPGPQTGPGPHRPARRAERRGRRTIQSGGPKACVAVTA